MWIILCDLYLLSSAGCSVVDIIVVVVVVVVLEAGVVVITALHHKNVFIDLLVKLLYIFSIDISQKRVSMHVKAPRGAKPCRLL